MAAATEDIAEEYERAGLVRNKPQLLRYTRLYIRSQIELCQFESVMAALRHP